MRKKYFDLYRRIPQKITNSKSRETVSKRSFLPKAVFAASALFTHCIEAEPPAPATRIVNNTSDDPNTLGTLPYWLLNANEGDIIDCSPIAGQSITLTTSLPAITQSYTINGAGVIIDGGGSYQAFQVASGNVAINNVTVQNSLSKGGNGGGGYSGGGGGVGGGGALYIHGNTSVTLTASSLLNNIAQGGDGGDANNIGNSGGGGGGGFGGGNGGNCLTTVFNGGGGGGHSNGADGGSDSSVNGGNGVYFGGGGGGAGSNTVAPGGWGGDASPDGTFIGGDQSGGNGGGGAGNSENGYSAIGAGSMGVPGNGGLGIGDDSLFGGGGGGGCALETNFPGGEGIGAAGGGGSNYSGGKGGVLGGGGGGGLLAVGGDGGFGAGGGGAVAGGLGGGGFGAGGGNGGSDPGGNGAGGGGSGLGGAIFIQGGGHLMIVDALNISGNTSIAGVGGSSTNATDPGHVASGDGAAMGYDIFMREEGSITFDLGNTLTISNPIEGDQTNGPDTSGGLHKIGMGTLKLNGANTYSGITHVAQGTLNLNGSVAGSALVEIGGKLSGNATISGNLTSAGILKPGNSIGTINTANLALTPSSLLEMEVASNGTSDLIAATGVAEIDGTLEVIPLPGSYQTAQSYTLITAGGGTTGRFSAIRSSEPSLLEAVYGPSAVLVEVLPLSSLRLNSNAEAAALSYLANGFTNGSDIEAVSAALLTLDADGIDDSFNQMQPSQFSGLAWSRIEDGLLIRSSYYQHLQRVDLSCDCCPSVQVWGEAIGAMQKQNSKGQQFGFTDWTGGATFGIDALGCSEFRFGVAGSYTHSRLNWSRSAGHADINSYYGGFYTNWSRGPGYVNAAVLGAYSHCRTDRHIHFASIDRHAKSSQNSWEGLAGLEAGIRFACDKRMELTPFVRLDYVYLSTQGFRESGASSLNLRVDRTCDQVVQSELGISWAEHYAYENTCLSGTFLPRIQLSYINDAPFGDRHLNASFIDSDEDFAVRGLRFSRNQGAASIGLTYLNCNETIGVTVRYDGQFSSNYYTQAANIALDIEF